MEGTTPQHEQPRSDATVNTQLAGASLPPRTGAPQKRNSKQQIRHNQHAATHTVQLFLQTRFSECRNRSTDKAELGSRVGGSPQPHGAAELGEGWGDPHPHPMPPAQVPAYGMSSAGGSRTLGPSEGCHPTAPMAVTCGTKTEPGWNWPWLQAWDHVD